MATGQTADRTMTEDEVGWQWAQVVAEVAAEKTRVIVEQGGKPVAAVISAEELERPTWTVPRFADARQRQPQPLTMRIPGVQNRTHSLPF